MRYLTLLFFFFFSSLAAEPFTPDIKISAEGVNKIGYLPINRDRAIGETTLVQIKLSLEKFAEERVAFVLLDLDTPGGALFPAMEITKLLQEFDAKNHIPVVALVNNWAVSAGAMVAYSCRYIAVIEHESLMGAAEAVTNSEGEMKSAPEKVQSALRAEFANLASYYGRNPLIAEAMVDKDILLVKRKGQFLKLEEGINPLPSDEVISARGKLLTLNAEQLVALGIAEISVKPNSAAMGPLFGDPFFAAIPSPQFVTYSSWKINFFTFLSHPLIAGLLLMALLLGGYIEFKTPGFGVPGSIALAALVLIALSSSAASTIDRLELVFLLLGALLLAIELFVIPGFGVIGILGIGFLIFGGLALLTPGMDTITYRFDPVKFALYGEVVIQRVAVMVGCLIVTFGLMVLFARYVTRKPTVIGHLVSFGQQNASEGFTTGITEAQVPIGTLLVATTRCNPAGKARLKDELFDVIAKGGADREDTLEVESIEGFTLHVKSIKKRKGNGTIQDAQDKARIRKKDKKISTDNRIRKDKKKGEDK